MSEKKVRKVIRKKKSSGKGKKARTIIGRILTFILVTLLVLVVGFYGVMWILVNGPSKRAKELFVISVRETSAVGWFANLYMSEEEINAIIDGNKVVYSDEETDTSLIQVDKTEPSDDEGDKTEEGEDDSKDTTEDIEVVDTSIKKRNQQF